MKKRLLALNLALMLFFTGCGGNKKNDLDFDLSNYNTITSMIYGNLKDQHYLDEDLTNLKIKTDNGVLSFADLEKQYKEFLEKENINSAEYNLSLMLKMIISSKLSDLVGLKAQYVLDNVELPKLSDFNEGGTPYITLNGKKYYLDSGEQNQFYRLVINYINAYLSSYGYNRPNNVFDRYEAGKEAILTSEKLDEELFGSVIRSDFDSEKVKTLMNK